jgi:hypothetical protein
MNKKRFTFLAVLFIAVSIFGQSPEKTSILAGNNQKMAPVPSAPEKISYQAVVRDAANAIVANKLVGMRISIVQSGSNSAKNQRPSAVYEETQTPTTNANGLLSIYIGAGTGSDDFSAIDWSVQPHYITIEIDPTGNNGNYTITGTTQLASVPYALYAKTSSDAGAVAANTAKVGYTEALVSANTDVAANTAKVGYTEALVSANTDVAANTAKVGYSEALVSANTDVAANTAKVGYTEALVSANTDVAANTAKVGYTEALVSANTDVAANTAKVGVTTHAIGDSFGGGIVFFVYDGGQHGLIAATADQSTGMRWYGGSYTNTRARADGIGAGLKNTAIIIANQGPVDGNAFAATVCNEYSVTVDGVTYGDWYLPSKHELNLLYIERAAVGGFTTNYYWSSTEYGTLDAWLQIFNGGYQFYDNKSSTEGVRAVRAF